MCTGASAVWWSSEARQRPGSESPALGSIVSSAHDAVMAAIPAQSLREMASPKNARATAKDAAESEFVTDSRGMQQRRSYSIAPTSAAMSSAPRP